MSDIRFHRSHLIPGDSIKISDKLSDAVAFIYTGKMGNLNAMVFYGKQSKPIWHYRFPSSAKRDARIAEAFANRQAHAARSASRRAERSATVHNFEVGHILSASWGYDQTNVNFYQVTAIISDKMIEVRPIASDYTPDGDMTGKVLPIADKFTGDPMRKRAGRVGVRIDSCRFASTWSGKPMYESSYA